MLNRAYLYERLAETEAADNHQARRIAQLIKIFGMKRKADAEYRLALELVNGEINRYLQTEQLYCGVVFRFLCDLIKSYQSFLAIGHQHKQALLDGYDQQIISFLTELKDSRASESIGKKAKFAEDNVARHVDLIKQVSVIAAQRKQKLKEVNDEMEVLKTEVRFKERVNSLTEAENRQYSEKLKGLVLGRVAHESSLEKELDALSAVSEVYFQTYKDIQQYQQQYLTEKTNDIVDTVMRVFVLEVAYIRSVENDVAGILKRLKETRDESKRSTTNEVDYLLKQAPKQNLKGRLWDVYKTFTQTPFSLDGSSVPETARRRWTHICQNFAKLEQ